MGLQALSKIRDNLIETYTAQLVERILTITYARDGLRVRITLRHLNPNCPADSSLSDERACRPHKFGVARLGT